MMELMKHPEKLSDDDKRELLIIKKENCDKNGNLTSGDKSAFPNNSDEFWAKINGNQESDCSDCPFKGKNCYYHAIKDSARDADIMIGNHALLLNDLVQRWKTGQGTIPDYHYLAIDEAHHVEQMLVDYFASNISSADLKSVERKVYWILTISK